MYMSTGPLWASKPRRKFSVTSRCLQLQVASPVLVSVYQFSGTWLLSDSYWHRPGVTMSPPTTMDSPCQGNPVWHAAFWQNAASPPVVVGAPVSTLWRSSTDPGMPKCYQMLRQCSQNKRKSPSASQNSATQVSKPTNQHP